MNNASSAGLQRRSLDDAPIRVVSARANLRTRLRNLWSRRELLTSLISSDIRIKYKNSSLGIFWSMLSPALTLGIYDLVFSVITKNGYPDFALYLFSGLVVWNMFQTAVNMATGRHRRPCRTGEKSLVPSRDSRPRQRGGVGYYFFIQMSVLCIFLLAFGRAPAWNFLWILPISFVALYLLTASHRHRHVGGDGVLRDMRHLMEVLLQLWFWLSPVVYSYQHTIAQRLHDHGLTWVYFLNPVTLIIMTFQRIFYVKTFVVSTVPPHPVVTSQYQRLPTWSMSRFFYTNHHVAGDHDRALSRRAQVIFGRLEGNFESEL
jgi:ABC-type polysaccharide/polyol phosphate export permease